MSRKPSKSRSAAVDAPSGRLASPVTVELWPVAEIRGYDRNARTHDDEQVDQIAASMQEFGWTVPVLVRDDGTIGAGHGRMAAAERLRAGGATIRFPSGDVIPDGYVPVLVARGWSDEQFRAYVLADNQLALNADWDETVLALELGDLKTGGFDLGLLAFDADDLSRLLAEPAEATPPDQFPTFDESIETEHRCPKCGYSWSGKAS